MNADEYSQSRIEGARTWVSSTRLTLLASTLFDRVHLPRHNRRTWLLAGGLVIVAIIVAVIAAVRLHSKPTGSHFNARTPGFTATTPTPPPSKGKAHDRFVWPIYGFNDARTRVFSGPTSLDDPSGWKTAWHLPGNAPIEFPPVIYGNALFFMDDNASVNKVNATTGKRWWRKSIGKLSAATPALDVKLGLLFAPVLSTTSSVINSTNGQFVAMSMKNGAIKWKLPVPSGSESSPLVWGDNVYFGDKGGTEYDVNALTGKTIWSVSTSGPIKGGATLAHGDLYFSNYAGQLYDVNASTGKTVWEENLGGALYASPTLAYGLVYIGSNTTGEEYALSQSTGHEVWSVGTGNYVYSSAAAATVPVLGPTVYFGSYTGTVYAVSARDGHVDWTENLGDSISGAASIVNKTVFFCGVYHSYARGYDVSTGKQVFSFPDCAYTATIASPKRVYLSGHYTLYGLDPKH